MATERLILEIRTTGTRQVERNVRRIRKEASAANRTLALLRSGLVVVAGARVITRFIELADTLTTVRNRLRLVTSSTEQLNAVQTGLFRVSQDTRASFEASTELFNRLTRSAQGLSLTYRDLLDITQGINQAIAISGATTQEARNSLIQFSQGLASGTLRGDELRSVVEQFPRLASAIGKEFGVAGGELAAFAKENDGILTTERIIKAIRNELPQLAEEFGQVQITTSAAFQRFNNALVLFIGGISESVRLGEKLDVILQSIARNLPEITVALLTIAGIGVFNILTDQVTRFGRTLVALGTFIAGPFLTLARVIITGPVAALRTLIAITAAVRAATVATTTLAAAAWTALRARILLNVAAATLYFTVVTAGTRVAAVLTTLAGLWRTLAARTIVARAAVAAFIATSSLLSGIVGVVRVLTGALGRLLLVFFANPVVLTFAAVIAAIVGAFLLFRKVVSDFIPEGLKLGEIFEVFAAAVLTAIDVVVAAWRGLGPALADSLLSSLNFIIRKLNDFFNFFIRGINLIIDSVNNLGASFERIDLSTAFQFENEFAGAGEQLADTVVNSFSRRLTEGGNVEELKGRFTDLLGFFRDFLPPDLDEAAELLLNQVADLGDGTERLSKAVREAQKEYAKLREQLDPLAAGLKEFGDAQKTVNTLLEAGVLDAAEGAETLNLLARNLVGLNNAEFELQQNLRLVNQLLEENAINSREAALAAQRLRVEAQGAFVSALQGTFPLLEANQKLDEIQVFIDENQQRIAASGLEVAEVQQRMNREALGLGQTYSQVNEQIQALIQNQEALGLSSSELQAEIRQLNIAFLETQRDATSGANLAFLRLIDDATNAAQFTEMVFQDAFKALEDAVVQFAETGKFSVDDFFRNLADQLLRLGTQQAIAAIAGAFIGPQGGGFGVGGPTAAGGGAGGGIGGLAVALAGQLFGFQRGGGFTVGANTAAQSLPGIDNRLVAFRARDGEEVTVTPRGGQVAQAPVNQVFNIQARDADSFRRSQTQIQNRALAGINQARRRR